MAKAIKHIQAGLLHIEVLGSVPEGKTKRRSARAGPTPPAQRFYNLKHSWQELELAIAANFQGRDLVLTFTYDGAHLPSDKAAAGKQFQKFIRRLREARRKRGAELRYIYVTEGFHAKGTGQFGEDGALEDKRLHHHGVFNVTGPGDLEEIRSLWPGGGYIRAEPVDVHYYRELAKYLTKEAREFGTPKPGERTWRGSRNLKKYSVEYIEIPTESVTLAPPCGAVDYAQFGEQNPYGYGVCVGARYLLFPKTEDRAYSYTQGRTPEKRNTA
jgi:hypothetical protein